MERRYFNIIFCFRFPTECESGTWISGILQYRQNKRSAHFQNRVFTGISLPDGSFHIPRNNRTTPAYVP